MIMTTTLHLLEGGKVKIRYIIFMIYRDTAVALVPAHWVLVSGQTLAGDHGAAPHHHRLAHKWSTILISMIDVCHNILTKRLLPTLVNEDLCGQAL